MRHTSPQYYSALTDGTALCLKYKIAGMSVDSAIAIAMVVPRGASGKPRAAVVPHSSDVLLCAVVSLHTL